MSSPSRPESLGHSLLTANFARLTASCAEHETDRTIGNLGHNPLTAHLARLTTSCAEHETDRTIGIHSTYSHFRKANNLLRWAWDGQKTESLMHDLKHTGLTGIVVLWLFQSSSIFLFLFLLYQLAQTYSYFNDSLGFVGVLCTVRHILKRTI